ncbi:hypothetical protein BN59_00679 [Legionella massiliensis]|uniref:Uncharacterized protein n=1 Tax=Legionella massiliensis TaxID=1034943 RepID=A0A078KPV6_9GAMM|nr:hypothetical protein [Legionella massiliensis]CDZ76410.1 hypothetical protein BN59_00679 [Legionella massiliensis]CEE12148.1 hypothetical protein BN1094_00679 [Legionella massiliensis]
MQSKREAHISKKSKIADVVSNSSEGDINSFVPDFELLMQTDLAHKKRSQPTSLVYDQVKREVNDAEEEFNKIKTEKGRYKRKSTLKAMISTKRKWLSDVDDAKTKNYPALWAAMLHGYQLELVVNQTEQVRQQGLVVKRATVEFVRLFQDVIAQHIEIEGKTLSWAEIVKYKNILSRFHQSIKTIVIEDKSEITLERVSKLFSDHDLTIEHDWVGHAAYTQIYRENNQLVITHCNRGIGLRSTYNLVYRINIAGLDLKQLRTVIATITGLEVKVDNEEEYKKFYEQYDKTLNDFGFSFSWGKHVIPQKIGNCVLANLKGLLKERLPEDIYKWCTTEMRDLSAIQHLINPMLQSGKNLKNKQFNIDTDDDFFHLRQLINYIFDKSVEGIVNDHLGKVRKSEALKKALKAIGNYERVINENKTLSKENRWKLKNYIHSKIDLYKKILLNSEMRQPEILYRVLWAEAQKILTLSSEDASKNEFFKHLIGRAARNPHIFSELYDYCYREERENSAVLLKLMFSRVIEVIAGDFILSDPENITIYRESLRRILIKECEKRPYDSELIAQLTNTHLTHINPTLYVAASVAMNDLKNEGSKYELLKSLFDSTLKNRDFLDLFVRNKMPQTTTFFRQQKESFDLRAFFTAAAEFIIESIELPLTGEKLQQHLDQVLHYPNERTVEKDKVKRFLQLFCYKQLLDSKKIDATNIIHWKNINVLANQCKQISYCVPGALKLADSVLDRYHTLKPLVPKATPRCGGLISARCTGVRALNPKGDEIVVPTAARRLYQF